MRRLVLVAAILLAPRAARADYYYEWACTGTCAGDEAVVKGEVGGFETHEACVAARAIDPHKKLFEKDGNYGGLTACEWREHVKATERAPVFDTDTGTAVTTEAPVTEAPPAAEERAPEAKSGPTTIPLARIEVAALAGPGYRVEDIYGMESTSGFTTGFEVRTQHGARPTLGLSASLGLEYSSVTAPYYDMETKPMGFVPMTLGVVSSPAIRRGAHELRADLGLDVGALYRVGCGTCSREGLPSLSVIARARAGIDLYLGDSGNGIGLDAVMMFGNQGEVSSTQPASLSIHPPTVLLRVSFIRRTRAW